MFKKASVLTLAIFTILVMSSQEIFTLLVSSLIPSERDEYLVAYENQELEVSYKNGSFYVVG